MKFRFIGLILLGGLCVAPWSQAASSFQTKEYYGTNASSYDSMNLAQAYELGFTGKGVTLGILDDAVYAKHNEFMNKIKDTFAHDWEVDWDDANHGSHVSGTMAAAKDGVGMHGVAFNANLVASFSRGLAETPTTPQSPTMVDVANFFLKHPEVRIVNNSWNANDFLENNPTLSGLEDNTDIAFFVTLGKNDKVGVIAGGNEGHLSPAIVSGAPILKPEIMGTMVNVIAADSSKPRNAVNFSAIFTNMAFDGAQDFSITAPGVAINSVKAGTANEYIGMQGTSMATPAVTGVLGLVVEAFPYMTNKQLTSTLFSTADKFEPGSHVLLVKDPENKDEKHSLNIVYFGAKPSDAEIKNQLTDYYNANTQAIGNYVDDKKNKIFPDLASFLAAGRNIKENATFAEVFGHGYVNAGKAVQGPGYFKASWLDPKADLRSVAVNGNVKELHYAVDTKGYTSVWSNDISQVKYGEADKTVGSSTVNLGLPTQFNETQLKYYGFASAQEAKDKLGNLDIGLTKRGTGTLFLTGNNSYQGYTVVEGGAISLSLGNKQGTVQNAWVQQKGLLMGSGTVAKNLFNDGLVTPGTSTGKITAGSFTQRDGGVLQLTFDQAGNGSHLAVLGNANLGGTLRVAPQQGYWKDSTLALKNPLLSVGGTTTGSFAYDTLFSPTLNFSVNAKSGQVGSTIAVYRTPDAYSQYATGTNSGNVGQSLRAVGADARGDTQNLFAYLDFSGLDGGTVARGLKAMTPNIYNSAAQASLDYNRNNSSSMLTIMQGHSRKGAASMTADAATSSETGASAGMSGGSKGSSSYAVIVPQGGGMYQQGQDGNHDSSTSYAGVLGAWNFHLPQGQAGFSLGYSRRQTKDGGDVAEALADVLTLGGQVLLPEIYPLGPGALWLYGSAALGVENTQITRTVAFDSFYRQNKTDYSAITVSTDVRLGWEYLGDYLAAGPFVGLAYGGYFRPDLSESGGNATALHLQNADMHSLRSTAGLQARFFNATTEKTQVQGTLSAAWAHELLDAGTFQANFAGYGSSFYTDNTRGRDSLVTQASVNISHVDSGFTASIFGGAETFRQQSTGFNVGLSLGWGW